MTPGKLETARQLRSEGKTLKETAQASQRQRFLVDEGSEGQAIRPATRFTAELFRDPMRDYSAGRLGLTWLNGHARVLSAAGGAAGPGLRYAVLPLTEQQVETDRVCVPTTAGGQSPVLRELCRRRHLPANRMACRSTRVASTRLFSGNGIGTKGKPIATEGSREGRHRWCRPSRQGQVNVRAGHTAAGGLCQSVDR